VHRDIKPANVMINWRGSEPDVVKVLDFGLVKALDEQKQAELTSAGALTGTPLYMSPEAFELPSSVDTRSDLYAVGAIGYFLLCGAPVFDAESIVELARRHASEPPESPAQRLGKPISRELEAALLACLEKSRAKRPQTARQLAQMLRKCPTANSWTMEEADAWWGTHERERSQGTAPAAGSATQDTSLERTIPATSVDSDD
jgi:serine/threonine protein kinase